MKTIELIKWRDIQGFGRGYKTLDEAIEESRKLYNQIMETVGWVIFENDEFIVVASTFDSVEDWNDLNMIPKPFIVDRGFLTPKKDE